MSKILWKSLLVAPVALGATVLLSAAAMASQKASSLETVASPAVEGLKDTSLSIAKDSTLPAESPKLAQATPGTNTPAATSSDETTLQQINQYSREGNNTNTLDQKTNVSELSDVRPGDWAYEALRQLVERYGCIAGYPDSTYRGNRAMTRYEFAAGLNSCLKQVEKLIAASTADFATKADLETLKKLTQEFQAELATLGTRVDKLEGRVGFLENHQFSTTTKLVGEAIFAVTDNFGKNSNQNTIFGDRVRLDLQTSFTGKDKLHTRLAAGNLAAFMPSPTAGPGTGSAAGTQTFNLAPNSTNGISLDWLAYEFPLGNSQVYVAATGGLFADIAPTNNPYFNDGDGGNGALSAFAQYSPIYRLGGGAGAGIRFAAGKAPILGPTSVTLAYLADNANLPANIGTSKNGLFNGDYAALAQLNFNVGDRLGLAATYVHGYHSNALFDAGSGMGVTGSAAANGGGVLAPFNPVSSNSYGIEAAFRLTNKVSLSGFGGATFVRNLSTPGTTTDANIWYYGGGLAFPDLGKKGNLGGIFAGIEPYVNGLRSGGAATGITANSVFHIEGFYKYQLTENISITPGVVWITSPNQGVGSPNKDAVIGTLRTTFSF